MLLANKWICSDSGVGLSYEAVVLNQGASINFQRASLTPPTIWKVWSLNLPIKIFVFTAHLKSGGLETKDKYLREAW